MGPYGSQNFKTLLLQFTAESFQTFPGFSSKLSSQNYAWDFWNFEHWNFNDFFNSAWICQQSSWNRNLSVDLRPSVRRVAIFSEPNARISFKFWLLLQLSHTLGFVLNFWNIFRIFFVLVNMGPYGSQHLKTLLLLQIAGESFHTFAEFSSQWSSQNYVWDFWNFENWSFNDFLSFP